jgi:hypothetical protein
MSLEQMSLETPPALPFDEWRETCETLHMWAQVVGKVRLAQTPLVNHWWNVPLYLTARGLTTSAMPHGERTFQIDFDFVSHRLVFETSEGRTDALPLAPRTVADFYGEVMQRLARLGVGVKIWTTPVEVPEPVPFEQDTARAAYDPEYANRFWRALSWSARAFEEFRAGFVGKCSPVHFFWGSFDLAVTRFSGRRAPEREGADAVTREAYSRGHQPRLLARRRGLPARGLLLLRRARTGGAQDGARAPGRRFLQHGDVRVSAALRGRAPRRLSRRRAHRVLAEHLRRGRRLGELGSRRPRTDGGGMKDEG